MKRLLTISLCALLAMAACGDKDPMDTASARDVSLDTGALGDQDASDADTAGGMETGSGYGDTAEEPVDTGEPDNGRGECEDGGDNDGDGWIDVDDPDCAQSTEEAGYGDAECNDGVDNDGDGSIDSEDGDCEDAAGSES